MPSAFDKHMTTSKLHINYNTLGHNSIQMQLLSILLLADFCLLH